MNYISKQLGGPIVQGFITGIETMFNNWYAITLNYLKTLSISSANEKHTEMIGTLVGFPRPLVQQELVDSAYFKFAVSYYRDIDIGFATSYSALGDGGLLSPVVSYSNLVYLDLTTYKAMLKIITKARWGMRASSMTLIDDICKYVAETKDYNITFNAPQNDITITFYNVSAYSVYIAGYILNYLFDTEPDITVIKETV